VGQGLCKTLYAVKKFGLTGLLYFWRVPKRGVICSFSLGMYLPTSPYLVCLVVGLDIFTTGDCYGNCGRKGCLVWVRKHCVEIAGVSIVRIRIVALFTYDTS